MKTSELLFKVIVNGNDGGYILYIYIHFQLLQFTFSTSFHDFYYFIFLVV